MSDRTVQLTDASIDYDVLKAKGPVLVEFWAAWAGPCMMMDPLLDEAAEEYAGRLTVAKLDIDRNPQTGPRYEVRSVPTLLLFKAGQVTARHAGALTKHQLTEFIDAHL